MYILGISAFYHDSAACLIKNGEIICAAQEERFTRIKHDQSFPSNAIEFCLQFESISINDVSVIAYYENPKQKFLRIIKTHLSEAPNSFKSFLRAMRMWITSKLWVKKILRRKLDFKGEIFICDHHMSHAASAFYPSPFINSDILIMDGVGEWDTTTIWEGQKNHIHKLNKIKFPHSLGLLYSAFTYYTGFKVNSGEYKLMGLAPYGNPKYKNLIYEKLVDVKEDGSFKLNMDYFEFTRGFKMTNKKFDSLFGRPPRVPESELTSLDMDLAASIQVVIEEIILKIVNHMSQTSSSKNLCLAGGVALNCVSNGNLYMNSNYENIWIQPAAGDAGSALGAAMYYWYGRKNNNLPEKQSKDLQKGSRLGTSYTDGQIKEYLDKNEYVYETLNDEELSKKTARLLADQNVIGWFKGRMEFGPRALGSRSILGDSRSESMQFQMNMKIKFRESFRPFAPIVLEGHTHEWFNFRNKKIDATFESPYMLLVGEVNSYDSKSNLNAEVSSMDRLKSIKSSIPAVTHINGSARLQTVSKRTNPELHQLLSSFKELTNCPVLINTSFNVRGEPIVESPEDAYKCFMRTEMDYLVLNNYLLEKSKQPKFTETSDWRNKFKLD